MFMSMREMNLPPSESPSVSQVGVLNAARTHFTSTLKKLVGNFFFSHSLSFSYE